MVEFIYIEYILVYLVNKFNHVFFIIMLTKKMIIQQI